MLLFVHEPVAHTVMSVQNRYRVMSDKIDPSRPMVYQTRIKGHLRRQWSRWFGGVARGKERAAGVIHRLLFGVAPHDPATFIGVAVMMAAIGSGACWITVLRVARSDPAITVYS